MNLMVNKVYRGTTPLLDSWTSHMSMVSVVTMSLSFTV